MLLTNLEKINNLIVSKPIDFKEKAFHILKTKTEQLGFSKGKAQHVQNMTLTKEYLKVLTDLNYSQMCLRHLKYLIKSSMSFYFQKRDIELLFQKKIIKIVIELLSLIQ